MFLDTLTIYYVVQGGDLMFRAVFIIFLMF
jgi:hypothetical protein